MKLKFETFFRLGLFLIVALFGYAVWADVQTNAPLIRIVEPPDYSRFREGTNVQFAVEIEAAAIGLPVEFYENNKPLPVVSNGPSNFIWRSIPRGTHTIVARVVYPDRKTVSSQAIHVRVSDAALSFGLHKIEFLTPMVLGIPLWEYVASLLYIFMAFYVSKLIDFMFRFWLKKWAARTETKFDDLLIELVHGPVKIIAFMVFLFFGLDIYDWPPALEGFLDKCFRLLVAFTVTYTLLKAVDMLMSYWKEKASGGVDIALDEHLFPIVRKSLKVFILIVAVLVTWQNLSEKPITAILASLSIGGLAIGLAAQDTIANFFGAVVVFMDKPFRIGDRIKIGGDVDGVVESIGLRSTRVRSLEGYWITVPNKTMGNATITNISRRPTIKSEINYGLTYDTSNEKLQRALEILREVYGKHPMTHDALITFNKFGDSALNILVVHWWKNIDAKAQIEGMQEMNLTVKKRFEEQGISFAFPSQTVYLKQDAKGS
jgi:MscS family membrane protein